MRNSGDNKGKGQLNMLRGVLIIASFVVCLFQQGWAFTSGQTADVVIGQNTMTTNSGGTAADKFLLANDVFVYNGKLFLTDHSNNRVLIYNKIPTDYGAPADIVVGQTNMASSGSGCSEYEFYNPFSVYCILQKMFVADFRNNRVLIYNTIPTSNNPPANVVVGQSDFTSSSYSVSANKLHWPTFVQSDGTRLYISDSWNHRILIYNTIPASNDAPANIAVGQADLTSNVTATAPNRLAYPHGICVAQNKLIVADAGNNRILIFNPIPTGSNASADVVIGQTDMTTSTSGCADNKLFGPTDVFVDGTKLYIADCGNNRILIYNTIPTTNGAAANVVLGQPDMNTNSSGCTEVKMNVARGIYVENQQIFASDYFNNRWLIFNDALKLYSISPNSGYSGQNVSVALNGARFSAGIVFKLKTAVDEVAATTVNILSSINATCQFTLNVPAGNYNVNAEMTGMPTAVIADGFTILPPATPTTGMTLTVTPTIGLSPGSTPPPDVPADFQGRLFDTRYNYCWPNPVTSSTTRFKYALREDARVKISVYTLSNQFVWSVEEQASPGIHVVEWNVSGMSNGVYFYRIEARTPGGSEEAVLKKLAILR